MTQNTRDVANGRGGMERWARLNVLLRSNYSLLVQALGCYDENALQPIVLRTIIQALVVVLEDLEKEVEDAGE